MAMRIFLVEDAKAIRNRLATIIAEIDSAELIGYATSVTEATARIAALRPDVVLLDLKLTDGSGLAVLQFVREQAPGTVVVVITNHSDSAYRQRCLTAGARFFLDKSMDLDKLPAILRQLVGRSVERSRDETAAMASTAADWHGRAGPGASHAGDSLTALLDQQATLTRALTERAAMDATLGSISVAVSQVIAKKTDLRSVLSDVLEQI